MLDYRLFYRRNLPHYQPPNATLFVTFRLADSIPEEVAQRLREEHERIIQALQELPASERSEQAYLEQRRAFGRWDASLDAAEHGPRWLQDPAVAQLVADSLHYRNGKVYDLDTFCLMPNHAHVAFTPLLREEGKYHALSAIMHSLKRHTAREANRILGREGAFWQHESYDHVVRDAEEHERIVKYILNNPVKAGLVPRWQEWPWSYTKHAL